MLHSSVTHHRLYCIGHIGSKKYVGRCEHTTAAAVCGLACVVCAERHTVKSTTTATCHGAVYGSACVVRWVLTVVPHSLYCILCAVAVCGSACVVTCE